MGSVDSLQIASNATIDEDFLAPGEESALFVEYEHGGRWHVFTTCDSLVTKTVCPWDVVLSTASRAEVTLDAGESLEGDDVVVRLTASALRLQVFTSADIDGAWFETRPGEALVVDALLDWAPAPDFFAWVGVEGLHAGAPTNPLELRPTRP